MDRYRGSSRRSPPPRDRPPLRHRDDHPDVEYFGQGESYRPGGVGDGPYRPTRERPATDSWNADRRDDRRRDDRREEIDSYIPPTSTRAQRPRSRSPPAFRRRSRSPFGRREELFPDRTRSPPPLPPPPRRFSPRRDDRARSPVRRRSRTPPYGRPRSPDGKRPRDFSTDGRRSPKRERLASPPRGRYERPRSPPRRPYSPPRENNYRPRSRTPVRNDRRTAYADDNWRRRSPSPRASGRNSNNTSRRSSPRAHPDRASLAGSVPRSPAYPPRTYEQTEALSYRTRSPHRRDYAEKSTETPLPLNTERDGSAAPPTGPAGYRNGGYDRAPPTGPSRSYNPPVQATPPTGPASQVSMSAHNRSAGSGVMAPTRPRGGAPPGRYDGPQRDFTSPPVRGRGSLTYRAPGVRSTSFNDSAPPSGPRVSSFSGPSRGDFSGASRGGHSSGAYSRGGGAVGEHPSSYSATFRGSTNSTSTTYPRTQRFNQTTPTNTAQAHLATLEKIVPGGKKLPSGLPSEQERRVKMLETEAEKMREIIREKQKSKRESVNEWEVRERESAREGVRSQLAEEALQKLSDGDEAMSGAAF